MKLYTEEQVREIATQILCFGYYDKPNNLIELPDYEKVTRFEVIDHTSSKEGRILVKHGVMVDVSIQDEGITMKVFLTNKYQP